MSTLSDDDWIELDKPMCQSVCEKIYFYSPEHNLNYILLFGELLNVGKSRGQIYDLTKFKKYTPIPPFPDQVSRYFSAQATLHPSTNKIYLFNTMTGSSDQGQFIIYDIIKNEYDISLLMKQKSYPKRIGV
eukprot:720882_1